MQSIEQQQHNAAVITKKLQERNGQSALGNLRLYYSDDETIEKAAKKTPGVALVGNGLGRVAHLI